ncbi:hypothetical protein SAMN05216436_10659 [bacterium A37T11]|nr:hypothetical protein SAMN05216436_10659 [bacterium A37T11]
MEWKGKRQSDNFEDRRGMSGRKMAFGGGAGAIIIALIAYFLGGDPNQVLNQLQQGGTDTATSNGPLELSKEEQELTEFVRVVQASTEDVWSELFKRQDENYVADSLVLYREGTSTDGCGFGQSAMGPFYCGGDQKVYLDLGFNNELKSRFGATGEFALAYVIAHEVGHHIQKLTGTLDKANQQQARMSEKEANRIQVKTELQADFYAGIWAHYANKNSEVRIDANDIDAGLQAAAAVGDDKIQMQAQGRVMPDAFTHGTSEQRVYWFKKGFTTGDLSKGDTFNDPDL